jgi:transposase
VINFPPTVRIFLAVQPADLRKGFDSLAALTTSAIGLDPLSGHLFVFRNRRSDRLKILYWDHDGYALWYKRLERGAFRFPQPTADRIEVSPAEMAAILAGIDLRTARRQRRYTLPAPIPLLQGDPIV